FVEFRIVLCATTICSFLRGLSPLAVRRCRSRIRRTQFSWTARSAARIADRSSFGWSPVVFEAQLGESPPIPPEPAGPCPRRLLLIADGLELLKRSVERDQEPCRWISSSAGRSSFFRTLPTIFRSRILFLTANSTNSNTLRQ